MYHMFLHENDTVYTSLASLACTIHTGKERGREREWERERERFINMVGSLYVLFIIT